MDNHKIISTPKLIKKLESENFLKIKLLVEIITSQSESYDLVHSYPDLIQHSFNQTITNMETLGKK